MEKITLNPYIFFVGNCREAMGVYKEIFGGELEVQTYDDVPGPTQEGMEGKVMHASLKFDDTNIFGSDTEKASPKSAKISLCLGGTDEAKLRKIFDRLSEGVEVATPLKKEFWGDIFGTVTDKYGVEWIVNISATKE